MRKKDKSEFIVDPLEIKEAGLGSLFSYQELRKLYAQKKKFWKRAKNCKETLLVPVPSISILDMGYITPNFFSSDLKHFHYHHNGEFAKRVKPAAWYLIRKTKEPELGNKCWSVQKAIMKESGEKYIPNARILVFTTLAFYLVKGESLFTKGFIRSADACESFNSRAVLGINGGLLLFSVKDELADPSLGCASAIRLK